MFTHERHHKLRSPRRFRWSSRCISVVHPDPLPFCSLIDSWGVQTEHRQALMLGLETIDKP